MDYELKSIQLLSVVEIDTINGTNKLQIKYFVGIVGDIYSVWKENLVESVFQNTDSVNNILAQAQAQGQQYVLTNYPNT